MRWLIALKRKIFQDHRSAKIMQIFASMFVFTRDKAILGVDMVGGGLHQRGYRPASGKAPLRETLAAAIILRCGWDESKPLLDPMCGSGTLLIEAAMMAANMAPGVKREKWGFESLEDFDAELWTEIKSEAAVQARRGVKKVDAKFYGFDNDARVLKNGT